MHSLHNPNKIKRLILSSSKIRIFFKQYKLKNIERQEKWNDCINGIKQINGRMDNYGQIWNKYNATLTKLIYLWALSENRLTFDTGKKQIQSSATRAKKTFLKKNTQIFF